MVPVHKKSLPKSKHVAYPEDYSIHNIIYWLVVSTPLKNMSQNGFIFPNFRDENSELPPPSHLRSSPSPTGKPSSPEHVNLKSRTWYNLLTASHLVIASRNALRLCRQMLKQMYDFIFIFMQRFLTRSICAEPDPTKKNLSCHTSKNQEKHGNTRKPSQPLQRAPCRKKRFW